MAMGVYRALGFSSLISLFTVQLNYRIHAYKYALSTDTVEPKSILVLDLDSTWKPIVPSTPVLLLRLSG
jgi:hypothetical protein